MSAVMELAEKDQRVALQRNSRLGTKKSSMLTKQQCLRIRTRTITLEETMSTRRKNSISFLIRTMKKTKTRFQDGLMVRAQGDSSSETLREKAARAKMMMNTLMRKSCWMSQRSAS